ncbi:uncharacterized protein [Nicotiana sylvestris]|uniref:uncharacterized protein n=1 Tax=Nicotiana sylvestris TaxID=4096 RepID=UPI00388C8F3B
MVEIQHGTHLGKPAIFFKAEDYFVNLAKECRFTIIVQDVGVEVALDLAPYSKSRGNVAKVKVEIDLLKPRLDKIWLGYKRLDGTDDGKWLDIEYEKEDQRSNERQRENHQSVNQDVRGKAKNGIVINEPTAMQKPPMKEDVLGKGQPSSKKTDTTTKPSEHNTSNKEDNNNPIDNDQNSRHLFQENNTNGENNTNLIEEEGNNKRGPEQNNNKNNHVIDLGDAHNTYLKLISGTILEEDKESENMYISNNTQMAESSFEDDGEEDNEEDGDYEDDMSIEETDDFESVDSESFQNEDQPVNHTTDDHAA